ncbi:MAG: DUF6231 family protein [Pseudomonadota bacterium]
MTTSANNPIETALGSSDQPPRVLLLGAHAQSLGPALLDIRADISLHMRDDTTPPRELATGDRFDLAILSDIQLWQNSTAAAQHIALLRDSMCVRLFVGCGPVGPFTRADCLALGLRGTVEPLTQSEPRNWYSYSIIDYKRVPDWLNADNWANPERWNRERW